MSLFYVPGAVSTLVKTDMAPVLLELTVKVGTQTKIIHDQRAGRAEIQTQVSWTPESMFLTTPSGACLSLLCSILSVVTSRFLTPTLLAAISLNGSCHPSCCTN